MIDLLAATLLMGAQAVFLTEILNVLIRRWVPTTVVTTYFPIVFVGFTTVLFDYDVQHQLLLIPAASFVALAIFKWLYSPVVIEKKSRY